VTGARAAPASELDELFAAPLKAFVGERKRLADQLKASGQPKEAKEIGKTPRPSVSAWVVNQLARQEAALLKSFAQMTARLRGAQGQAAKSGRAEETAEALAAHREVLKRLRGRAEEILVAAGQAARPQILERVVRNLRVGMAGEETRRTIESGRLIQDIGDEDFVTLLGDPSGSVEAVVAHQPKASGRAPSGARGKETEIASRQAAARTAEETKARIVDETKARIAEETKARTAEETKARAAAQAERLRLRTEAERRVRTLRPKAEGARRTLEKSERGVEAARRALADAEEALRQARLESEQAANELELAEAALESQR